MEESFLRAKLCFGVEPADENDEYRKVEKVFAPFMKTLKKRKQIKTDMVADEYEELYLKSCPKELLVKLQDSYSDPIKITTLLNETGQLLKSVTNSKCFNLYLTDYDREQIVLVSEYVPVNDRFEQRFPIETGTYLASHVAYTKEYVISADILGDVRFPQGIPLAGPTVKAVMCVPIVTNVQDNCIGVIELYRDCSDQPYNLVNLQICSALTAWLGIAVEQNTAKLNLAREQDIHKQMSLLANLYFSRALPFEKIMSDILAILKTAVKAEKGSFHMFYETVPLGSEETLYADAYEEGYDEFNTTVLFKKRTKLRYGKNEPGIAGYVARNGEVVNIKDAFKDSRFDRTRDSLFFRTRSLLCFPIKSSHGVVAVLTLSNRLDYPYFRKEDIDLLSPHLSDVGLVCQHYELDMSYEKLQLKLIEGERLLDYQTKPTSEDLASVKAFMQMEQFPVGFFKFDWDSSNYEDDAHKYIVYAIMNSDLLEPCFDLQALSDFVFRVKKGHRTVPYHNFEHAFCVFHCVYLIITKNKDVYDVNETISLVLAAICHDIDHTGFTNSFIGLKNDIIFQLYEDFCGEIHRYETTLFFIQSSNLLGKFSSKNYQVICQNLKRLIVSFDISVYFQNRKFVVELMNSDSFNWTNPEHRILSQNMILICADNCYCFKTFETAKKFTSDYYKELQHQGDIEKSMELEPLPIMDRNKSDSIPENQIILLNIICIPTIQIVIHLFPNLSHLMELTKTRLRTKRPVQAMIQWRTWAIKDKRSTCQESVDKV